MSIRRIKNYFLDANNLRKFVGNEIFLLAVASKTKLEISNTVSEGKVLVLSPHPDDESLGCGGVIKLHTNQGDDVKIIFLTDGSANISDENENPRKEEAKQAAAILGTEDLEFWTYKESNIDNKKATDDLKETIKKFSPQIVYIPSFLDPNPDHFAAAQIFAEAIRGADFSGMIFSYEVWSPIYANRLITIDSVFVDKEKAISCHKSQLSSRSYLKALTGLAQYRAGMYNAGEYAEGFFACKKDLYLKLFSLVKLEKG